jgi:hypothetical protein
MVEKAKFEAVRTQAIESEHTSPSITHGTDHEIRVEPQTLSWWQASKLMGVLTDILAMALSCIFFVYALTVKMHQNVPLDDSRVKLLLNMSNLVSVQHIGGSMSSNFEICENMADTQSHRVPLSTLLFLRLSSEEPSDQSRS